jgi:hypothetical protein
MDGMLSLFETVAHSDCNDALLQAFLKICTEHQAFVTKVTLLVPSMPHPSYGALKQDSFIYGFVYVNHML